PAGADDYAASLAAANRQMRHQKMSLGQDKPLEVALSALLLNPQDVRQIGQLAERVHQLVEQVLEFVIARPERLQAYFPDQQRIFPYLAKTPGASSWQILSRYDAAVPADGQLKIMELNTACPGAFMISEAVSSVTKQGFQSLNGDLIDLSGLRMGTVQPRHLRDALLQIEEAARIEKGTVGLLTDENELTFELDQLVDAFHACQRQAIIADARQLQLRNGQLCYQDHYFSLVYNKFRISTPHSPNHCWRDGFAARYAAFLQAQQAGKVVSVNNLAGLALGENKALLALLHDPVFQGELSAAQRQLVEDHILWTARLADGTVDYHGDPIDLLETVRQDRQRFVIKPANEGRGYGVVIGKYVSRQQWHQACQPREDVPQVVQEFVDTLSFPVVSQRGDRVQADPMYLTLGLGTIAGRYAGLVSRISTNPVTNVARDGFGQAVFVGP
ncbi:MAG: glutathionylspermidine synthase family protein, partial [Planctomycetales bacterium]|nr:glutathionylspermidine synthase family protein [Planctomycetales bacterium]NIM08891.1 glutathionylspermidine synthase family protein [Planctomycetales bacterium]NIN08351.1 glutathionylspermidine synthase family protein [Planctomycetales bacterium]NIN77479.1 glutathionylspermidine synthase family protein [Planctomycetales bacterium]NIO34651.1 glutathionylspermidine synthase family protein [Planctomycetales bacterium]